MSSPAALLASIPSPSVSEFSIGSLEVRYYGLMIALGVVALVLISWRRFGERNLEQDLVYRLAWVGVPAGIVGARIYHVVTDWDEYSDRIGEIYKIQEGGLGVPGAVLGAAIGLWVYARVQKLDIRTILDAVAPVVPLTQAIGRIGNWFNQELYGRPTDLPWGLEIDESHRVAEHAAEDTFHPTFAYEAIWNLGLIWFLFHIDKKGFLPKGRLFGLYVLGYATGRLWIEFLRVDFANQLIGVRVNVWVISFTWLAAFGYLIYPRLKARMEARSSAAASKS